MDSFSELPPPPTPEIGVEIVVEEPVVAETTAVAEQVYSTEVDAVAQPSVDR